MGAPSTIDRIIDVFPPKGRSRVRIMIANSLQAIVTQALLTADGSGRVAARDPAPDNAVHSLIRQAKIQQVYSVMQTNTARSMQTMEQALRISRCAVSSTSMLPHALSRPDELMGILGRGFDVPLRGGRGGRRTRPCGWPGQASDSIWKKALVQEKEGEVDPGEFDLRNSRS
jgi:hypothetical protein